MSGFSSVRRAACLSLLASTAMVGGLVFAGAAQASPMPIGGAGTTTITLGGPAVTALQAGGCGALTVTGNNGVVATQTAKSQWKLAFKIAGVEAQADGAAFRVLHSGSVELQNTCYDITLAALRISNFGQPGQLTSFDLSAVQHSADDSGRSVVGTLDLTNAQLTITGTKVRVEKMDLSLSSEGAEEFNELATGTDAGPFSSGMKVGNAKISVTFQYPAV